MRSYSLSELAQQIGATIRGNADVVVSNIAPLDKADEHQLTFISNAKFREKLAHSQAGILVVSEADVAFCSPESNLLIVKDPYVAYAKLAQYMDTFAQSWVCAPILVFFPIKQFAPITTLSPSTTPDSITLFAPIETFSPNKTSSEMTALFAIPLAAFGVVSIYCANFA